MTEAPGEDVEVVYYQSAKWHATRAEFLDAQSGQCAICRCGITDGCGFTDSALGQKRTVAQLDHCHTTGFVRGVLCFSCNTKLGWYEKNRLATDAYLAQAGEFAAYHVPERVKRSPKDTCPAWVRRYWQNQQEYDDANPVESRDAA